MQMAEKNSVSEQQSVKAHFINPFRYPWCVSHRLVIKIYPPLRDNRLRKSWG
jgi:hypothetical protein